MNELKPNQQRAKQAIILILIVLASDVLSLISSCMQYGLLETLANGGFVSDEAIDANDIRELVVGIIGVIFELISAVTFIMWFRRAYWNLHQKINYLSYSEHWAATCWLVPFVNLYCPYQIMREMYVETKKLLSKKGLSTQINYTTKYLGLWWGLWISTGLIGQFIFRFTLKGDDTIDHYVAITIAYVILMLLRIPLALITVKVIKDYSKAETVLAQIGDDDLEANKII